jgi:hypothetical protein
MGDRTGQPGVTIGANTDPSTLKEVPMAAPRWFAPGLGGVLAGIVIVSTAGLLHSAPQQQAQGTRVPGTIAPGATAVQVVNQPAVQVANQPTVTAVQSGEWRMSVPAGVTLAKGAAVNIDGPDFLEPGKRYSIRWGAGLTGSYTIVQLSRGWALVRSGPNRLWINTALAVAIEEEK